MAANWPIGAKDLRHALGYSEDQDDTDELTFYAAAACERIDRETGRHVDPGRHEIGGKMPITLVLAARKLAKLWWNQDKKGPRAQSRNAPEDIAATEGIGGIDLPRVVAGMLEQFPPRPGFGV
ncbi:head-tail connector protein [Microbacterium arborescens]